MEKAEDDLRSRGFVEEPDGVIVVEFEQDAPQFGVLDWILPAVHAQTVNVSGGNRGRVVWSAWNDGDNRTWEGNITGQSYTYSAYNSANMQFDVASRTWAPHTLWHAMQGAASTCATAGAVCAAFGPGYFNLPGVCVHRSTCERPHRRDERVGARVQPALHLDVRERRRLRVRVEETGMETIRLSILAAATVLAWSAASHLLPSSWPAWG